MRTTLMFRFLSVILIGQLAGLLAFPGTTLAGGQPPAAATPAPEVAPAPAPKVETRGLGRIPPVKQYDHGNFRAVVTSDGKTHYFPRLTKHHYAGRATVAIPDGPLGRATPEAMKSIRQMYGNDAKGDCVMASRAHKAGILTANDSGTAAVGTTSEVLSDYCAACGGCGRVDNGCNMATVNQYEQRVGIVLGGVRHKTDGSVAVDNTNWDLVRVAILVFGTLNVGIDLPNSWYQSKDGATWDVTSSGIVGGHEIQAFDFDNVGGGRIHIATWAGVRYITKAAFTSRKWVNELYTSLGIDWYGKDNVAPNGFDVTTLKAALQMVANGQVPPLPDPVPPGPPVPPMPPTPPTPPTPPVPPIPPPAGKGFTGTLVYKDGILQSVTQGDPAGDLKAELNAAGIDPNLIAAVLQLVSDVKAKKGFAVILADVMTIISLVQNQKAELAVPEAMPAERVNIGVAGLTRHGFSPMSYEVPLAP